MLSKVASRTRLPHLGESNPLFPVFFDPADAVSDPKKVRIWGNPTRFSLFFERKKGRRVSVSAMLVSMRQKYIAQVSILERFFFVSTYQAAGPDTCLAVFVVASLPLCL